jgi:serine/threonine protein kinase
MRIGPYELISELACGGMAQLWLVHRVWPDGQRRSCALKLPRLSAVTDEALIRQFFEEGRVAILLRHPNIVNVFDMGVHQGMPYLVMDFIPGADLAQLARAQARQGMEWELETAIYVVRGVAQGLRHAHNYETNGVHQHIVHRDVASKNVMIDGAGGVLLADFGVATSIGTKTSRMHTKGTLAFMAPEHYLTSAIPASDVFGLGAILWELLAGRPFRGGLEGQALREAVVAGRVEPVGRELPGDVQRMLHGMLEPDAKNRITLDEVLTVVEPYPSRRRKLERMVSVNFGSQSRRTGLSQIHFAASKELLDTLRVVEVAGVPELKEPRPMIPPPRLLPADFAPGPVVATAKVDPAALLGPADEDVDDRDEGQRQPDAPVSRHHAGRDGPDAVESTVRTPGPTAGERWPGAATARISTNFGTGARTASAGTDDTDGRGSTAIVPGPGMAGMAAEPGPPLRVETERSIPFEPAAVEGNGHARWHVPATPTSSPGAAVGLDRGQGSTAPLVGPRWVAVMVGVVLLIAGSSFAGWLMGRAPEEPMRLREVDAPSSIVAAVGQPPTAAPVGAEAAAVEPAQLEEVEPAVAEPAVVEAAQLEEVEPRSGEAVEAEATVVEPAATEDPQPEPRSPDDVEPVEPSKATESAEVVPSQAAPPATKPKPRPPKPIPSLELVIRRGLMVDFAEFRLGRDDAKVVPARGALRLRVAPGTYPLRWRTTPDGPWQTMRYTFSPNTEYAGHVELQALRIGASAQAPRSP